MKSSHVFLAASIALTLASAESARAALSFTGAPITENFDSYTGATGRQAWTNDSTIPGVSLYMSGGTLNTTTTDSKAGPPDIIYRGSVTSTVSSPATTAYPITSPSTTGATFAHYLYEASATSGDGKLGLFNADGNSRGTTTPVGYISAGFTVTNNTGSTLPGFFFTYTPSTNSTTITTNADPVSVSYAYSATGVADADGTWTNVPGMGYSTSTGTAATGTDPLIPPVVTGPTVQEVNGQSWLPGQTLTIRFKDFNVGGVDRYTQIDNVAIIPEPAALSLLGLGGFAFLRRSRKAC